MTIEYFRLGKDKFNDFKQKHTDNPSGDAESLLVSAYSIQADLDALRKQRGDDQIGYKVGCISETIQSSLGIYQPIFGRLYAFEHWNSGITHPLSQFDGLAIEGELAVKILCPIADLADQEFTLRNVISGVFPVIELHHFSSEELLTAPDMVARNAIHAGFVSCKTLESNDQFPNELVIKINEVEVARVSGEVNYRTVTTSLRWLADTVGKSDLPDRSNQIILCGSIAPLFPLTDGGHVEVTTDNGMFVECTIE